MSTKIKLVEYEDDGQILEAYHAYPEASTSPLKTILICHAWSGRSEFECVKARSLAELGYAAFAIDVYGKGILGQNPQQNQTLMQPFVEDRSMLRRRLKKALTAVKEMDHIDKSRVAAIGYCFGGLCVLDMARADEEVQGVVSFHGLLDGVPGAKPTPISAKILALHGWNDPMVPPATVEAFGSEMNSAGADWQLHAFGGVYHAFTKPGANDPDGLGVLYDADADERSWQMMQHFLKEILV
tara:strand:- start:56522 stop:57244 length:723 start_codon:yes stop_codon:yes gene_type:complete